MKEFVFSTLRDLYRAKEVVRAIKPGEVVTIKTSFPAIGKYVLKLFVDDPAPDNTVCECCGSRFGGYCLCGDRDAKQLAEDLEHLAKCDCACHEVLGYDCEGCVEDVHPVRFTRNHIGFIMSVLRDACVGNDYEEGFKKVYDAVVDANQVCEHCGGRFDGYCCTYGDSLVDAELRKTKPAETLAMVGDRETDNVPVSLSTCSHCGKVFVEGILCGCDEEREDKEAHTVHVCGYCEEEFTDHCTNRMCKEGYADKLHPVRLTREQVDTVKKLAADAWSFWTTTEKNNKFTSILDAIGRLPR